MRSALLLSLALLLAGCLSSEGAQGSDDETARPQGTDQDETVETADAGATEANESEGEPAPMVIPLVLDGRLATGLYACAFTIGPGYCVRSPGDSVNVLELTQTGRVSSLTLTLTWTASSPGTEELNLGVYSAGSEYVSHGHAFGPSPLTLTVDKPFTLNSGDDNAIFVTAPTTGGFAVAAGAFARVTPVDQPFKLEGVLTLVPS